MLPLLALVALFQTAVAVSPEQDAFDALSEGLLGLRLDTDRIYPVEDLTLDRDAVSLTFSRGAIAFLEPHGERVTGAVFVGSGVVRVLPPNPAERASLTRFTGSPGLDEAFSTAVLRFTDETAEEILQGLGGGPQAPTGGERALLAAWQADRNWVSVYHDRVLTDLAGAEGHPLFVASVEGQRLGWFDVSYDSRAREEVAVYALDGDVSERVNLWTSFDRTDQDPTADDLRPFDVVSYAIHTRLPPDPESDMHVLASVTVRFQWSGERVARFGLEPALRVGSVRVNGVPAAFLQAPAPDPEEDEATSLGAPLLTVLLSPPTFRAPAIGEEWEIEFEYRGNVFRHSGETISWVDDTIAWYPRPEWRDPADFYTSFGDPGFTGVCDPVFEEVLGDSFSPGASVLRASMLVATGQRRVSCSDLENDRWMAWSSSGETVEREHFAASFVYGRFESEGSGLDYGPVGNSAYVSDDSGAIYEEMRTAVAPENAGTLDLFFETAARGRGAAAVSARGIGLWDPARLGQRMLSEIGAQAGFFVERFGPYPFGGLKTIQLPIEPLEGWPTTLHVSTLTFLDPLQLSRFGFPDGVDAAVTELARALGLGSQWFGQTIGWETYRDRWLVAALAAYSGVVYLEDRHPDSGRGEQMLALLREALVASNRPEPGPVWLGERLADPGAVNAKSVWVVHMLRMLMRDPEAEEPDRAFFEMLTDLLATYRFQTVTTWDFKAVVERHMTEAMDLDERGTLDWFFDQWVFSTGIPTYSIEYTVEDTPGGFRISGRIDQSGVTDFVMPVPLYARSSEGERVRLGAVVVDVVGGEFTYLLDERPVTLEIDPYNSILKR